MSLIDTINQNASIGRSRYSGVLDTAYEEFQFDERDGSFDFPNFAEATTKKPNASFDSWIGWDWRLVSVPPRHNKQILTQDIGVILAYIVLNFTII